MISIEQIFFGVGAMIVVYTWANISQRTGRATGTITSIGRRVICRRLSRVPIITFTVGKNEYSFQPGLVLKGEARDERIGTKVKVAYNPSNPTEAEDASPWRLYFGPILITVLYIACAIIALRARLASA